MDLSKKKKSLKRKHTAENPDLKTLPKAAKLTTSETELHGSVLQETASCSGVPDSTDLSRTSVKEERIVKSGLPVRICATLVQSGAADNISSDCALDLSKTSVGSCKSAKVKTKLDPTPDSSTSKEPSNAKKKSVSGDKVRKYTKALKGSQRKKPIESKQHRSVFSETVAESTFSSPVISEASKQSFDLVLETGITCNEPKKLCANELDALQLCENAEKFVMEQNKSAKSKSDSVENSLPESAVSSGPTAEEFDYITQQLHIMNEARSRTPTNLDVTVTRTAGKKSSAINKHRIAAVKRAIRKSPRKARSPRSREVISNEIPSPSNSEWLTESGESDVNELMIDSSDEDLDIKLEENAAKNNLTAINVKNILHHVVTNEHVLDMVQNTLTEDSDREMRPAVYEPKMTRSKTKLGQMPEVFPWLASPAKNSGWSKSTILNLNFPEEEEDDDYEPEKDIMPTDSDADSVVSSFLSDFGSPCPSTPTTPRLPASLPSSGKARSPSKTYTSDHELFQSPINRPPVNRNSAVRQLGRKFQDALGKVDEDDPEIVAHRTRSKVPLNDKSLLELEASFVAPDITPDMYDMMHYDDPLYSSFLTGLFDIPTYTEQPAPVKEVTDDETNDPEYNFLAEWEEPDEEDLRNDRGTRVPKKELNALFEELLVAYGDGPEEVDPPRPVVPRPPVNWKTPARPPKRTVITLTPSLTEQIHDQMLKHVQLLTQVFVLSTDVHQHKVLAMLYELKNLGDCVSHGGATGYHPANLLPAIDIVQQPISPSLTEVKKPIVIRKPISRSKPSKKVKDGDQDEPLAGSEKSPVDPKSNPKSKGKSMSPCEIANMKALQKVYRDLPYVTKDLFSSHRNVFCFPQLLPTCLFFPEVLLRSQKLVWMPSEDNLIAFGLEQAGRKCHTYIHKHLLPCKSPNQIRIRIKNQVARKENNVIKTFVKERKLPDVKKTTELNNIESMYPDWYKDFIEKPPVTKRERSHSICQGAEVNTELKRLLVTKIKPQPRRRRSNSAPPALYPSVPTHNDVNNIPTLSETLKMLLEKDSTENRPVDNNDGVQNTSLSVSLMQIEGKIHNVAVRPELLALTAVGHQSVPMQQQTADVRPCAPTDTTGSVGDCDAVKPVGPSTWIPCIGQAPLITLDAVPSSLSRSPLLKTEDRQLSLVKTSAITCVNQSIIFSQVLSASSLSFQTTSTMSSGLISSTGVSGLQPLTSDQLSSSAQGTPKQSQSAPNLQGSTKTRSAVEIIASVAPFLASSPDLNPISPEKEKSSLQTYQEKTPPRPQRAILYRRIMPSPQRSPAKVVLPYVQKALRKNSPRRKKLKRQAKAILPKGFVIKPEVISPVKKAASKVRNKAVRSRQMLHKLHKIFPKSPGHPVEKSDKDTAPQAQAVSKGKDGVDNTDEDAQSSDDAETLDSDSDQGEDGLGAGSHTSHGSRARQEESHPSPTPEADSFDSQTEEDDADDSHLHELMQASSTIRSDVFPKRKGALKVRRSKAQRHKDSTLAMLDPDIVHTDPFRDDRDIAFAQAYLHSVQTALKDKPEQYGKFLKLLHDFGKNQGSPVQLYEDIRSLLGDHPELVEDFSGFLLPDQAVRCGCYMANRQYHRVRSFLRKLEIHFEKHSSHFQKIIRTFCQWKPDRSAQEIRSHLQPLLKGQRHLLEELSLFFEDERPPESHPQDFEEVDLCDSDADEDRFLDGFEEVELSDDANFYGTKRCECACHHTNTDIRFFNRRKHCNKCGLKVVGGKLYFRSTGNNLIPAKVIYHKSFWMDETRQGPDSPKSAIKAHVNNALNSSENTAKTNGHFDKEKETPAVDTSKVTCLVRKRIKPITLSRSVSQSTGRFMSLDEVDETQTNSPWIKRIQARTEEVPTQSKSAFTRVSQATVVSEKPAGSLKINPRRTLDQSSELNAGAMSLNPQVTTLVLNSSKAVRSLSPVEHCEKNTSAPASPFQNIQENTLPQRVSSPQNVSSPVFDSPHKPQTSLPHFVPSPPKDSSSSVSQDILTKALKAALVTSSDCKLSDDNSSSAKFSQTNNTDTVQPNTQQSQDHCCEEGHANHKERYSATQEQSDFQPVEVNVSGLSSKLTGMNSIGQEAVCGFRTERTLVDSPKPMLPTLTVQQGETTILGRNQGEIIEQGFQGGCSETRDQSDHSENPSSQSATDNQTKLKWSREEDKLILETCKQFGPLDNTFQALTSQISHKSKSQIQERFETLMKLLKSKQPVTEENQT